MNSDKKKGLSAAEVRQCRNPGLNRGPLDLQSNALPTELFRPTRHMSAACGVAGVVKYVSK